LTAAQSLFSGKGPDPAAAIFVMVERAEVLPECEFEETRKRNESLKPQLREATNFEN
jgi:hypothetical protein